MKKVSFEIALAMTVGPPVCVRLQAKDRCELTIYTALPACAALHGFIFPIVARPLRLCKRGCWL